MCVYALMCVCGVYLCVSLHVCVWSVPVFRPCVSQWSVPGCVSDCVCVWSVPVCVSACVCVECACECLRMCVWSVPVCYC